MDGTLTGSTTPGQCVPKCNGNEGETQCYDKVSKDQSIIAVSFKFPWLFFAQLYSTKYSYIMQISNIQIQY